MSERNANDPFRVTRVSAATGRALPEAARRGARAAVAAQREGNAVGVCAGRSAREFFFLGGLSVLILSFPQKIMAFGVATQ